MVEHSATASLLIICKPFRSHLVGYIHVPLALVSPPIAILQADLLNAYSKDLVRADWRVGPGVDQEITLIQAGMVSSDSIKKIMFKRFLEPPHSIRRKLELEDLRLLEQLNVHSAFDASTSDDGTVYENTYSCPRTVSTLTAQTLTALILASKFLHDRCYSSRAWMKLSGLPPREVNKGAIAAEPLDTPDKDRNPHARRRRRGCSRFQAHRCRTSALARDQSLVDPPCTLEGRDGPEEALLQNSRSIPVPSPTPRALNADTCPRCACARPCQCSASWMGRRHAEVRRPSHRKTITLEVRSSDTIGNVKAKIHFAVTGATPMLAFHPPPSLTDSNLDTPNTQYAAWARMSLARHHRTPIPSEECSNAGREED
ncbi:hypothetical protein BD410DRAFT_808229 [Rickenella mellea]|uniref:Uncharacterized protein n=1 Tax=Rickenella mellea TaxID=50990 RepID=A0A4Y7PN96_9AGAM|nr:hypothetical protein BD410DRAFT_808229 [Rickenella mellea]